MSGKPHRVFLTVTPPQMDSACTLIPKVVCTPMNNLFLASLAHYTLPFSLLGWPGLIFIDLVLLLWCGFLAVFIRSDYGLGTWVATLLNGWLIHATTEPLYQAAGEGFTGWWWVVTLGILGVSIGLYMAGGRVLNGNMPNFLVGLLAPVLGVVLAGCHDWLFEELMYIPEAWQIGTVVLALACLLLGSSRYTD